MEIRVIQNYRGKFNLFSNEESLSFIMAIYGDDNKIIEVDGIKAKLELNKDIEPFDSPLEDIPNVFNECFDYAKSVISSTNYEAQCLLFAKIYQENFEQLCENRIAAQKIEIQKEIERLQNRLKNLHGFDDISWEVNNKINKQVQMYEKWLENKEKEIAQIKEGTDKHKEVSEAIDKYKSKIEHYNNSKVNGD